MVTFSDALDAIHAAVAIQQGIAENNARHPDESLRVRIGLHTGEAIRHDGDFFGRNVVLAARVAATAVGGQILVTSQVARLAASSFAVDVPQEVELKGLAGTHRVHEIAWAR